MTYQFSIYSRAEALLLLDLAYEHRHHVAMRCRETNFFTEISLNPETSELQDYFDYMLRRLRERQRQLESIYRRSPSEETAARKRRDDAEEAESFLAWQNPVII